MLARTHADFCLPSIEAGPLLCAVRAQLAARAERLGWLPGLADGARLHPHPAGGEAFVAVLDGTRELRLHGVDRP